MNSFSKNLFCVLAVLLCFCLRASAQNPIDPPGRYTADPTARVWNDGKLYIYGSRDVNLDNWCSWSYYVLSTSDLKTWEMFGESFASKGENDKVAYSDGLLWAPDCIFSNGKYYLYYCMNDRLNAEGVAVGTSPSGPFGTGMRMNIPRSVLQIDPAIFVDDDGTAYYLWGQTNLKMARLKPNMTEIDTTTIRSNVINRQQHFFHEGIWMFKRNGLYYLVYTDESRDRRPTCVGYSTATNPWGPYTYRGVIVDNRTCDPQSWNNHPSVVEFRGQWYVVYHRSTHNSKMMRKTCLDPITFRADGTIPEVEMTSQGASGPLNAYEVTDAMRACSLNGNVRISAIAPDNEALTEINHQSTAAFKYLDFGKGARSFTASVPKAPKGGSIEVRFNSPTGAPAGSCTIPAGGSGTFSCPVSQVKGVAAVYLTFTGASEGELFQLDWIRFQ